MKKRILEAGYNSELDLFDSYIEKYGSLESKIKAVKRKAKAEIESVTETAKTGVELGVLSPRELANIENQKKKIVEESTKYITELNYQAFEEQNKVAGTVFSALGDSLRNASSIIADTTTNAEEKFSRLGETIKNSLVASIVQMGIEAAIASVKFAIYWLS